MECKCRTKLSECKTAITSVLYREIDGKINRNKSWRIEDKQIEEIQENNPKKPVIENAKCQIK